MKVAPISPMGTTLRWLADHAGFPARSLEPRAVTLVCVGAIAAAEEASVAQRHLITSRDPAQTSAARQHALRRSQVHFKCDNSAKV